MALWRSPGPRSVGKWEGQIVHAGPPVAFVQ